jgi:two-component system CheB/CheR fusion protein
MQRLLSVRSTDIGRSINDIRLHLSIEDLEPILTDVLDTLGTRELEVQDRDGRWYLLRVRPYRTSDNKIEGLVVLLVDIDQIRRGQQELRDARDFSNSMLESVPTPIAILNQDCTIRSVNGAFRELSGIPASQLHDRSFPDLFQFLWGVDSLKGRLDHLCVSEPGTKLQFEHTSTTARRQILLIQGQAISMDGDRAMLFTVEDVTMQRRQEEILTQEKTKLEHEITSAARTLERTQEELRGLTAHLFTAQDEERRHVARELHDDISQKLSVLDLNLKDLQDNQDQTSGGAQIEALRLQVGELANDVRQISHRLHPAILDDLGLPAALKALVEEFGEREGMPATYASLNLPEEITPLAAAALYRITQEALRNVAKHAGRTHVKVILEGDDENLTLQVIDLGVGFDQESDLQRQGLGLISMTERARLAHGNLAIKSALGKGTTLTVEVPIRAR